MRYQPAWPARFGGKLREASRRFPLLLEAEAENACLSRELGECRTTEIHFSAAMTQKDSLGKWLKAPRQFLK